MRRVGHRRRPARDVAPLDFGRGRRGDGAARDQRPPGQSEQAGGDGHIGRQANVLTK